MRAAGKSATFEHRLSELLDAVTADPPMQEVLASGACAVVDRPGPIAFNADGQLSDGWPR